MIDKIINEAKAGVAAGTFKDAGEVSNVAIGKVTSVTKVAINGGSRMTMLPVMQTSRFLLFRRLIIFVLAGLLIFYHSLTLYEMYVGTGSSVHTLFDYVQSILRMSITISLLLVIFGVRWALWVMWFSISGLVATQYWAHFGNLPVDFTEGRHPLSYLKGFIFPTIITLAFPSLSRLRDSNAEV